MKILFFLCIVSITSLFGQEQKNDSLYSLDGSIKLVVGRDEKPLFLSINNKETELKNLAFIARSGQIQDLDVLLKDGELLVSKTLSDREYYLSQSAMPYDWEAKQEQLYKLLSHVKYPVCAKANGINGEVRLLLFSNPEGCIDSIIPLTQLGFGLEAAAENAARAAGCIYKMPKNEAYTLRIISVKFDPSSYFFSRHYSTNTTAGNAAWTIFEAIDDNYPELLYPYFKKGLLQRDSFAYYQKKLEKVLHDCKSSTGSYGLATEEDDVKNIVYQLLRQEYDGEKKYLFAMRILFADTAAIWPSAILFYTEHEYIAAFQKKKVELEDEQIPEPPLVDEEIILPDIFAIPSYEQNLFNKKAIFDTFEDYKKSLSDKNGKKAVRLLDKSSISYYSEILDLIQKANKKSLMKKSLADKILVLRARASIPPKLLRNMRTSTFIASAINLGILGNPESLLALDLGQIDVKFKKAWAPIMENGKKTSQNFEFYKEEGIWKFDLQAFLALAKPAIEKKYADSGLSEEDFIFEMIANLSGKKPDAKIWKRLK